MEHEDLQAKEGDAIIAVNNIRGTGDQLFALIQQADALELTFRKPWP